MGRKATTQQCARILRSVCTYTYQWTEKQHNNVLVYFVVCAHILTNGQKNNNTTMWSLLRIACTHTYQWTEKQQHNNVLVYFVYAYILTNGQKNNNTTMCSYTLCMHTYLPMDRKTTTQQCARILCVCIHTYQWTEKQQHNKQTLGKGRNWDTSLLLFNIFIYKLLKNIQFVMDRSRCFELIKLLEGIQSLFYNRVQKFTCPGQEKRWVGSRRRLFKVLWNLQCPVGLSQKRNMCAFQWRKLGTILDGPPKGKRELRNDFGWN